MSHFFPTPFEKKFFPFEIIPFLCLALSEVDRELERFRESDAYKKWKEEKEGKLVPLTVMSCAEMHTIHDQLAIVYHRELPPAPHFKIINSPRQSLF